MTKRARNESIGEVACPHRGCDKKCDVFKFRPRTPGKRSQFTGKMYAECPTHGRFGADGNAAMQEYILAEGTIRGAASEPEKPAPAPAPAPAAESKAPAQPARAVPSKRSPWATLLD